MSLEIAPHRIPTKSATAPSREFAANVVVIRGPLLGLPRRKLIMVKKRETKVAELRDQTAVSRRDFVKAGAGAGLGAAILFERHQHPSPTFDGLEFRLVRRVLAGHY